jgi:hypothetical protein
LEHSLHGLGEQATHRRRAFIHNRWIRIGATDAQNWNTGGENKIAIAEVLPQ